jgi:hypothetical protein
VHRLREDGNPCRFGDGIAVAEVWTMRLHSLVSLPAIALLAASLAAPVPAQAGLVINPGPILTLAPTASITAFEYVSEVPYNGALPPGLPYVTTTTYSVTITNTGTSAVSGNLHADSEDGLVADYVTPFSVPAKSQISVLFTDPQMAAVCAARTYHLWLDGQLADSKIRTASLDTACMYNDSISDSLSSLPVLFQFYERENHLTLSTPKLTNEGCGNATIDVDVVNNTKQTISTAVLNQQTSHYTGDWNVPTVAPGQTVHMQLPVVDAYYDVTFQLVDPTSTLAGKLTGQKLTFHPQVSCQEFGQLW